MDFATYVTKKLATDGSFANRNPRRGEGRNEKNQGRKLERKTVELHLFRWLWVSVMWALFESEVEEFKSLILIPFKIQSCTPRSKTRQSVFYGSWQKFKSLSRHVLRIHLSCPINSWQWAPIQMTETICIMYDEFWQTKAVQRKMMICSLRPHFLTRHSLSATVDFAPIIYHGWYICNNFFTEYIYYTIYYWHLTTRSHQSTEMAIGSRLHKGRRRSNRPTEAFEFTAFRYKIFIKTTGVSFLL